MTGPGDLVTLHSGHPDEHWSSMSVCRDPANKLGPLSSEHHAALANRVQAQSQVLRYIISPSFQDLDVVSHLSSNSIPSPSVLPFFDSVRYMLALDDFGKELATGKYGQCFRLNQNIQQNLSCSEL